MKTRTTLAILALVAMTAPAAPGAAAPAGYNTCMDFAVVGGVFPGCCFVKTGANCDLGFERWTEGPVLQVYEREPHLPAPTDLLAIHTGWVRVEFPPGIVNHVFGAGQSSPCEAFLAITPTCAVLTDVIMHAGLVEDLPGAAENERCLRGLKLTFDRNDDGVADNAVPSLWPTYNACDWD